MRTRLSPLFSRANAVYLHDLVMTGAAFALAFYLRVGEDVFDGYSYQLWLGLAVLVPLSAVIFRLFSLYRGIWRYASLPDLSRMAAAVTTIILCFVLFLFLLNRLDSFPRSLPPMLWFVLLVLLGAPRLLYRMLKDRHVARSGNDANAAPIPLVLFGADDAADLFIRSVQNSPQSGYRVVGVIDPKGRRTGRTIQGIEVFGFDRGLAAVVATLARRRLRPHRLVLSSTPEVFEGSVIRALFSEAEDLNLHLSRLPRMTEFRRPENNRAIDLHPVAVEDLLGRPQVTLDRRPVSDLIQGNCVLVTGAGGTIGSELCAQIAALQPSRLVVIDNGEYNLYEIELRLRQEFPRLDLLPILCDVRDRRHVSEVFTRCRPHLAFHAAALKHLPIVETNPVQGILTNVIGTRNVADAALASGVRAMVLISTDKAVRPSSVMGATKRLAECYCQGLDMQAGARSGGEVPGTRFMTVRFGNVIGSSGSVIPLFRRQLTAGGPLTVTHPDVKRYFMTVREAVQLVLQASAHGARQTDGRGKIFVLDMGEPVRILDVAQQMIRLAGLRPGTDIEIRFIGLRPGEKLCEELLEPAEGMTRGEVAGVLEVAPNLMDHAAITRAIQTMEAEILAGDHEHLLAMLHAVVPGYQPPLDLAS